MSASQVITELRRRFGLRQAVFQSRVARRVFALFVFAALAPILVIASLYYVQTTLQSDDIETQQLHVATKTMGMALLGEFRDIHDRLRYLASLSPQNRSNAFKRVAGIQLLSYATFDESGQVEGVRGAYPTVSAALRQRAARGVPTLLTRTGPNGLAHLYMAVSDSFSDKTIILGELNMKALSSDLKDDDDGQLCILTAGEIPTYCDRRVPRSILNAIRHASTSSNLQSLTWDSGGKTWKGGFWTVYTAPRFQLPSLTLLWALPENYLVARQAHFEKVLPPTLAFTVLIVVLLSINLIRRILAPLDLLKTATRTLATGDFTCRVQTRSGDEFEDLAGSFNTMAADINQQFHVVETMTEMDRRMLSAQGTDEIISILLARLPDIAISDCVEIAVLDGQRLTKCERYIDNKITRVHRDACDGHFDEKFLGILRKCASHVALTDDSNTPLVRPLLESGFHHVLCFPIRQQDTVLAVVFLGYRSSRDVKDDIILRVQGIADHAALAFSNAAWEEKLYHQAHYDVLTGLPNRQLFASRLDEAIAAARRQSKFVALLFIDIDRFKSLNDTIGHHTGDDYLVAAAGVMKACIEEDCTLARLGGDEFTVIVPDCHTLQRAMERSEYAAEMIRQRLLQPLSIGTQDVALSASIGIALSPTDADSRIALARCADQAMYYVKEHGRNGWHYYSGDINDTAMERLELGTALAKAIEHNELAIFLQPQICSQTGKLCSAEVLLRWKHPKWGMVSPAKFIPIAEQTGLIVDIGAWVLEQACMQIRAWQNTEKHDLPLAINVSAVQMRQSNFIKSVIDIVARHDIDPSLIELEVTESMCAEDVEATSGLLTDLKRHGFSISIDDFGTGYSSLRYLQHLPVDTIKIDQSFVRGLPENSFNKAITGAILSMAANMNCTVVAEGVETEDQLKYLQDAGCQKLQGYHISRPMPVDDFNHWHWAARDTGDLVDAAIALPTAAARR